MIYFLKNQRKTLFFQTSSMGLCIQWHEFLSSVCDNHLSFLNWKINTGTPTSQVLRMIKCDYKYFETVKWERFRLDLSLSSTLQEFPILTPPCTSLQWGADIKGNITTLRKMMENHCYQAISNVREGKTLPHL